MLRSILSTCGVLAIAGFAAGQTTTMPWSQLSLSTCGVDEYLKQHPDRDGRGVVIAVLDTGVDIAVAGLDKMPDGSPKVIDVQDFSGEGDIELSPAAWNEKADRIIRYDKDGAPQEYVPPPAGARPDGSTLWLGVIEEKAFVNTSVPDINDNGRKDDEFVLLVVVPPNSGDDDAVVFVDAAGDRDFSKSKPLKNHRVAQDCLLFPRPRKEKQTPELPIAVNVFPRQRKVVLHFDDGGHGTHVAGIAAGWRINGQDGFNGVAPGAKVISLKIGVGALSGGATTTGAKKRAFEYAAKYAREHRVPVVCNLSFGVGSQREGHSDIDTFLDKLLVENPNLIVCTSAGNNGPGLSSVGTPAAATHAITCAALMAADTARDVWGIKIPGPVVTTFSSRGGDLPKPDVATPGYATSTVTTWNREGDFFSGTSMASPYAAGMCALLVCDARAELGTNTAVRSTWAKAALQRSASPVAGFTPLDYGAGIPNMTKSASALRGLVKSGAGDPLVGCTVETESPLAVGGTGPTAYWRSSYAPTDRPQVFTIKPAFGPTADAEVRRTYSKRFAVRSSAAWCKTENTQIYFRAEQAAEVRATYDAATLARPGLYFASIDLLDGDAVAGQLWNTVIVPYRLGAAERYRREFKAERVSGWIPKRYFVAVPTGATAMHLELKAIEGQKSTAGLRGIFRPDGTIIRARAFALDPTAGRTSARHSITGELVPGVWELCATSRRPDEESAYDFSVRFDGVAATPAEVTSWDHKAGKPPSGSLSLLNAFETPLPVTLSGELEGVRKTTKVKLSPGSDSAKVPITFEPAVQAARIHFRMSPDEYAMFTDVAINVFDPAGSAILKAGMEDPDYSGEAASPGGTSSCELEIRAAFTYPDSEQKVEFEVEVDYLSSKPIPIAVKRGDATECTLYPGVATPLDFKLTATPPKAADAMSHVGYLRATSKSDGTIAVDVPVVVKP